MNTATIDTTEKKEILIYNHTSFKDWTKSLQKFSINNELRNYTFSLPEFTNEENQEISNQVNFYSTACGCKSGSVAMAFAFVTMLCHFFLSDQKFSEIEDYQFLSFIAILLVSAIAGKVMGLLHAHWNLIKLADDVKKRLNIIQVIKQNRI